MKMLLENPEFIRHLRGHTRKGKSSTYQMVFLAACGVCVCVNLFFYYQVHSYASAANCFRSIFFQIIGANFLLLLAFGAHGCGDSVSSERQSNTLDFQRITGMNPYTLALGKIIGVPFIHYLLAAVGMPVTMLCVICGGVSLTGWLLAYLLLVVFGLSYCSASTLGSAFRKRKTAQRTSPVILLLVFAWFGPTLLMAFAPGPRSGIPFGSGIWSCLLPFHSLSAIGSGSLESYRVTVFGLSVAGIWVTILANALVFLVGWAGTARRLENDSQPLWTKPQLLAGSLVLFALLGSYAWNVSPAAQNPWMSVALSTLGAHTVLFVVASVAAPGLYPFRLGVQRRQDRLDSGRGWLAPRTPALALVITLAMVYLGILVAVFLKAMGGLANSQPSWVIGLFIGPVLFAGMAYTAIVQWCKWASPENGLKLSIGIVFLWLAIPMIAGFLLKAWDVGALGETGWRFVLYLSPVGACFDSLQGAEMDVTPLQFWGALGVQAALTGGACWFVAQYQRALTRRFASQVNIDP